MDENISRAAGSLHGQEMLPEQLESMIHSIGRAPMQRSTTYSVEGTVKSSPPMELLVSLPDETILKTS